MTHVSIFYSNTLRLFSWDGFFFGFPGDLFFRFEDSFII